MKDLASYEESEEAKEHIRLKNQRNKNRSNDCRYPIIQSHSKKAVCVNSLTWYSKRVCKRTGHLTVSTILVSLFRMNGTRRYNIPMFGVKHWYEHEMEAVGHLASMEDAYLRRMYASKVVNGMNHLTKAIDEKVADPGYEQKKRDLELMKASVMRTMEHLKKDYDVSEGNISYKWNTGAKNATMPSSYEPNMNTLPSMNAPPSFNENTLSLNEDEPMSLNENESVLTLNNMKNFATAKTNTAMNLNNGTLNLNAANLNNANKNVPSLNALSLNEPTLNASALNEPTLNASALNESALNAPALNAPKLNNTPKANNNKNKNTLVGGRRRKHKRARHTRRR